MERSHQGHIENNNVQNETQIKARNAYLALLLSICPGLGQQYSGYLIRGVILYVSLIVVSWVAAVSFMFSNSTYVSLMLLFIPVLLYVLIGLDAVRCSLMQPVTYTMKWYNRNWIYMAVFTTLFLTVNPFMDKHIGKHIVRAYFVNTNSMSPSVLQRDVILINKLSKPKKCDVVLIEMSNGDAGNLMTTVIDDQTLRRVIAVQGDEVEVRGRNVYVNGELSTCTHSSYGQEVSPNYDTSDGYQWGPGIVPKGAYFVLSDAREYSFDSRMFGFVGNDHVTGIATKVFWSWNHDDGHFIWGRTAKNIN